MSSAKLQVNQSRGKECPFSGTPLVIVPQEILQLNRDQPRLTHTFKKRYLVRMMSSRLWRIEKQWVGNGVLAMKRPQHFSHLRMSINQRMNQQNGRKRMCFGIGLIYKICLLEETLLFFDWPYIFSAVTNFFYNITSNRLKCNPPEKKGSWECSYGGEIW